MCFCVELYAFCRCEWREYSSFKWAVSILIAVEKLYLGKIWKHKDYSHGIWVRRSGSKEKCIFFPVFSPVDCTVLFVIQCLCSLHRDVFRYKASSLKNTTKTIISGSRRISQPTLSNAFMSTIRVLLLNFTSYLAQFVCRVCTPRGVFCKSRL